MTPALQEFQERAQARVHAAARDAVAAGWADLAFGPSSSDPQGAPADVRLAPRNPRACPLWLGFDVPGEAYVSVGRNDGHFEIWRSDDVSAFEEQVGQLVEAVIAGRYEEWVSPFGGVKGVLYLQSGTETFCTNTLGLGAGRLPWWRRVSYAPYASAT